MERKKLYKLNLLSEEEIAEIMDSVETDEEADEDDYDSDDSIEDPDFDPQIHQISPENERAIDEHLANVCDNTDLFVDAINFSINLSIDDVQSALSTLQPILHISNEENVETEPQPSTSTDVQPQAANLNLNRPSKRGRSPLPSMEITGPEVNTGVGGFTGGTDIATIQKDSKEFSNIVWKQKNIQLHVNDVAFQGDCSLPTAIKELETPMQLFCYFFTPDITKLIAEESNRHALKENINASFQIDNVEVYKYIGCMLYMSLYRYPNLESYWSKNAFYHFVDMAATNSYILYRRIHAEKRNDSTDSVQNKKLLQLLEFREKIASGLVKFVDKRFVGRPTSRPPTPTTPPPASTPPCNLRIGQKAKEPIDDIHFDGFNHNPTMLGNSEKRFCKLCKTSRTQFFCEKCHLHLCITVAKNCFGAYHRRV